MKQKSWMYVVWPLAMIGAMFLANAWWHNPYLSAPWIAGVAIVMGGVGGMLYQIKTGGDTSFWPYGVMFLGLLLFCILGVHPTS